MSRGEEGCGGVRRGKEGGLSGFIDPFFDCGKGIPSSLLHHKSWLCKINKNKAKKNFKNERTKKKIH